MPKDKANKRKKKKVNVAPNRTAAGADKYELYGLSVQEPSHEAEFFETLYEHALGKSKKPTILREDFCGTFAVCREWVKRGEEHVAIGVDLDPEPLAWGRKTHYPQLTEEQVSRITLFEEDVRSDGEVKADILAAQNFSFFIFKERAQLLEYYKAAHANIAKQGIMVLDMFGGPECHEEGNEDVRTIGKGKNAFKYVWETEKFDPINANVIQHIGFRFKDGTAIDRCLSYDWRFWTLPEVRELLSEAGFDDVVVYWEQEDEDGEGNGEYHPAKVGTADPSWVCYVIGVKR